MSSNRKLKKAKPRVNKVKRLPLQVELLVKNKKKLFWIFWHKKGVICHLAFFFLG